MKERPPVMPRRYWVEDVARVLGITTRTVYRWEQAGRIPPRQNACWLAEVIDAIAAEGGRRMRAPMKPRKTTRTKTTRTESAR